MAKIDRKWEDELQYTSLIVAPKTNRCENLFFVKKLELTFLDRVLYTDNIVKYPLRRIF